MAADRAQQVAAPDGPQFEQAYASLRGDGSVQFELTPLDPPPQPPKWLQRFGEWLSDALAPVRRFFEWLSSFMPDAPVARILLWTVLIAAAAALLWILVERIRTGQWRLPRWRRRAQGEGLEDEDDYAPAPELARAWLKEAEALAARGEYAEAVHHLLKRSIEDIEYHRPRLVRPAHTSRDLAAEDGVPATARQLFATIVAAVERSLFGGRAISEAEWTETRAAYAEFALRKAWHP